MAISNQPTLPKGPDPNWEYCGVKLTIHNIIIPVERLSPTPSQLDNMDPEMEIDLRIVGCELIQDSGVLLKLPQVAMATAQVLYQRFFYSKSFVRHFYEHYAMACVFLAAKLEECPRRIRDIINVFHHMRQIREKKTPTPVMLDQSYTNLKNQIIKAERRLLKELGFCVHAKHPHKLVICYLQALGQESNAKFVQTAWNYMNDSLRTDLFVRYLPEAIACACIYLASCKLGIPLPKHPAWWEMFTVDEESVREIALCLVRLYARPKANIAELEAELAKLRKSQVEAKEREIELKKVQNSLTPDNASDHSSVTLSPNAVISSKKLPVTTKGSSSSVVGDSNSCLPDMTQSLPPNSILASALATAKAVAASITASKTGTLPGTKLDSEGNTSARSPDHGGSTEQDLTTRDHIEGNPRQASKPSPDLRENSKRSTQSSSSGRPSAYPNISPQQILDQHRATRDRKRKTKQRSSRRRRSSRSPSSSSSSSGGGRTSAYISNNRHYRSQHPKTSLVHDASTSGSGTPSSSPSPPKRQKLNVAPPQNLRRLSRSSSIDSRSSVSSVESPRARVHSEKKSETHNRRSPPAAYRLDRTQDTTDISGKSRLTSKAYLSNGATRNSESRSHHRHREGDRRHVSREHRRR